MGFRAGGVRNSGKGKQGWEIDERDGGRKLDNKENW